MKHLISLLCLLLLPACVLAQTSGQNVIQKKNASAGFSYESFTLGNSQLIGRTSAGVLNGLTLGSGLSLSGTTLSATGSTLTIGTSAISGGTSGHVLYNNAGTLGGLNIAATYAPIASPTFTGTLTIGNSTLTTSGFTHTNPIFPTRQLGFSTSGIIFTDVGGSGFYVRVNPATPAANVDVTLPPGGTIISNTDTGTVTNAMLAGSIAASKLVGTDIATVGTITSGTWNGTTIAIANGGTGATTASAARIALLPSMTGNGGKFLRVNAGATDYELAPISGGGDALTTNPLSQFASTTSSQLAGVLSDETGTGAVVLASSPTLTTPNLGTPSAATLTNATGLPVSTGISGLGTGVATWLATPSSSNFASALTDETGTGAVVLASSPALTTPSLGTPSSVTLTNATGLPLSTGVTGTLPIANGGTGQTTATAAFDALSPNTTKGDITVHNGTNNVRLAGGTDGHVLTRDSTAASGVKWAAASGGGSGGNWVLISTTTISGSPSTLDFTFSGSYRRYRLELEDVTQSSPFSYILRMQTSTDGGSTFDSSSANYGYSYGPLGTYGPVSTTGTYMQLLPDSVIGVSDVGVWGEIDFYDPLNASTRTFAKWNLFGRFWSTAATNYVLGSGVRDSAADVDAVRLFWSSGTFAGGKVRLFGWSE